MTTELSITPAMILNLLSSSNQCYESQTLAVLSFVGLWSKNHQSKKNLVQVIRNGLCFLCEKTTEKNQDSWQKIIMVRKFSDQIVLQFKKSGGKLLEQNLSGPVFLGQS